MARLRKGAFLATSGTSYPCLLPLLASLRVQTLLAPADGRAGAPPFCAALLETLWTTISNPGGGGGGGVGAVRGERGGASGWRADVASAHVECATFLLLKLPPPPLPLPEGNAVADDAVAAADATAASAGGGGEDTASAAVSVSAATENVVRAVKSLAADDGEEDTVVTGEGLGRGRVPRAARKSPIIGEAFSRALGQLHLGAEKGAGVMGSVSGAAAVWGALLRELKGALDQR